MSAPTLVWFRRDLRLADHDGLWTAAGRPVIPVFCWAPEEDGPWAPGGASRWWLHQSLAAHAANLARHGSRLVLRAGPTLPTLLTLAAQTGARRVVWTRALEPATVARDAAVAAGLRAAGLTVDVTADTLLFEPEAVRTGAGSPFQVFTPFWRRCRQLPAPPAPRGMPPLTAPATWPESLPLGALGLEPRVDWAAGLRRTWQPGEAGAAAALARFVGGPVAAYETGRDRADRDGTSRLSPHLHHGEVSPRQVWHAVAKADAGPGAERFLAELGWREFAHHLLHHFPETPESPLRPAFRHLAWAPDAELLAAWQHGQTGYPIVDAALRCLWATGFMPNRLRMVAGSFLVKDLLQPWLAGARWFWDTLVDADLANNTLGWQWVAGCGADAAPYYRIFNPVRQGQVADPEGTFTRTWVPELAGLPAGALQAPWTATAAELRRAGVTLGRTYPQPVVDHAAARARALAIWSDLRQRED